MFNWREYDYSRRGYLNMLKRGDHTVPARVLEVRINECFAAIVRAGLVCC